MFRQVLPFSLDIPEAELEDLRLRLTHTRWPEPQTVDDWSQGVPLQRARDLVEYWRTTYDWRRCERMLNGLGQFTTEIDGLPIYFLHIRSPHADALPLLLTHGWPGSVIEFHKVIAPLVDPVAHGGDVHDAFDVVVPALPGYGFSGKPARTGWSVARTAEAWIELMRRLGYRRFVAQGGDWGALVTVALAGLEPQELAGIHLNMCPITLPELDRAATPDEQDAIDAARHYVRTQSGYGMQQATRPQTLGYGLADSPAGQAMWIYEKFAEWADCGGDPETVLTKDELLDNIMLYWLPNTGASSARLYWESFFKRTIPAVNVPAGFTAYPRELSRPPRHWLEPYLRNLVHWGTAERGGHFAAFEQPVSFVDELRACFALMR